jgi:hypothetical protein
MNRQHTALIYACARVLRKNRRPHDRVKNAFGALFLRGTQNRRFIAASSLQQRLFGVRLRKMFRKHIHSAQRQPRMSAVYLSDSINREETQGIDAEFVHGNRLLMDVSS